MKTYLLLILIYLPLVAFGQKQQPQWLMPLFFEDGNGERDTVYMGYDDRASDERNFIDTLFNEDWLIIDSSKFSVWLFQYPNYSAGENSTLRTDTVRKTNITSFAYPEAIVGFGKGKLPITIKWVDSLLYSPNLYFPDISPRPRGRIDVNCGPHPPCPLEEYSLSLTDYVTDDLFFPITDSLVFGSEEIMVKPENFIGVLWMQAKPHNYKEYSSIAKANNKQDISIFPNPFTNFLQLANAQMKSLKINIYSTNGVMLNQTFSSDSEIQIELSQLPRGLYFIMINDQNTTICKKIIKF